MDIVTSTTSAPQAAPQTRAERRLALAEQAAREVAAGRETARLEELYRDELSQLPPGACVRALDPLSDSPRYVVAIDYCLGGDGQSYYALLFDGGAEKRSLLGTSRSARSGSAVWMVDMRGYARALLAGVDTEPAETARGALDNGVAAIKRLAPTGSAAKRY